MNIYGVFTVWRAGFTEGKKQTRSLCHGPHSTSRLRWERWGEGHWSMDVLSSEVGRGMGSKTWSDTSVTKKGSNVNSSWALQELSHQPSFSALPLPVMNESPVYKRPSWFQSSAISIDLPSGKSILLTWGEVHRKISHRIRTPFCTMTSMLRHQPSSTVGSLVLCAFLQNSSTRNFSGF